MGHAAPNPALCENTKEGPPGFVYHLRHGDFYG
jgi:hypothetical protein